MKGEAHTEFQTLNWMLCQDNRPRAWYPVSAKAKGHSVTKREEGQKQKIDVKNMTIKFGANPANE